MIHDTTNDRYKSAFLDVNQLSKMLNIKPKTIYDWVHKNSIPYVKLGKLLRFDENEIRRWLESKRATKNSRRISI